MRVLRSLETESGFSMIEVLITLSIFSIGFMGITASVIAASGVNRTTAIADQAVFLGQDMTESLAGIALDAPGLDDENVRTFLRGDQKVEITVFDAADRDGNGRDDFKTIGLKVWVRQGDDFILRLENYYRRPFKD